MFHKIASILRYPYNTNPRADHGQSAHRKQSLWIRIWFVGFGLCLYLLTTGAYLDNPDGRSMYSVTRSLVLRGGIAIPLAEKQDSLFEKVGRDGTVYSKYGLVQPLLQVPLYLIEQFFSDDTSRSVDGRTVALFSAIITALTLPLLWSLAAELWQSTRIGLAITLIYALATMAWLYATLTYSEPLLTLELLACLYLLRSAEAIPEQARSRRYLLAGSIVALAILTKYPAVIYVPALFWYLWHSTKHHARAALSFGLPLTFGVACLAFYNVWRFGDVLNTGYHIAELTRFPRPIWYGIFTLLFSPGKSIFIYAPPLLVVLAVLPTFLRRFVLFGRCVLGLVISSVIFYALVSPWCGAWSPGPRYHLPILPLLLLALGCVMEAKSGSPRHLQLLLSATVTLGVLVQLAVVSISYEDVLMLVQRLTNGRYAWGFWFFDPDYTPVLWQAQLAFSGLWRMLTGSPWIAIADIPSVSHRGFPVDILNPWFASATMSPMVRLIVASITTILLALVALGLLWWKHDIAQLETRVSFIGQGDDI